MTAAGATPADAAKRAAGEAAAREIRPGMVVGLGTGSTAAFAIKAIGARVREGLDIVAVATSERSAAIARSLGITVRDFADVAAIDLGIDGVDEIDPAFRAIKGAGGAMLREKIVATSAARMIAVADPSKRVATLGTAAVPVEVLPFARAFVTARVTALGAVAKLRIGANGQCWLSDQGNIVLDCRFGSIADPAVLAGTLAAIPGLLGHGLFLDEIDEVYVGAERLVRHSGPT